MSGAKPDKDWTSPRPWRSVAGGTKHSFMVIDANDYQVCSGMGKADADLIAAAVNRDVLGDWREAVTFALERFGGPMSETAKAVAIENTLMNMAGRRRLEAERRNGEQPG